ncbi:calcium-binding protein [Sulfitobacter sp. LCG007]
MAPSIQEDSYSNHDRLIFTDVNADDVTFAQNAGDDLVITMSNGETITILDHFANYSEDMGYIEFADGTTLGSKAIRDKKVADMKETGAVIGSEHMETYRHTLGDGSYSIRDFSYNAGVIDTFVFTDANQEDVTFSQNADQDLIMTLMNDEEITIIDHFKNSNLDMEQFIFADGTTLAANELILV